MKSILQILFVTDTQHVKERIHSSFICMIARHDSSTELGMDGNHGVYVLLILRRGLHCTQNCFSSLSLKEAKGSYVFEREEKVTTKRLEMKRYSRDDVFLECKDTRL